MQDCLAESDFDIGELKTEAAGMSLFLCLPSRYMNTHYRWLRMMLNLIVGEMEAIPGRPATGYPVLMLLDEFAALRRMESIEHGVAQMAGFGVKMFFVVQALTQLKAAYKDNWETFLANCGLKLFFNIDENFTREYVCKLIGETEVMREVRSEGASSSQSDSLSESQSEGQSESSSLSRSENRGTSVSHGSTVSEGTNRSVSRSASHGENRSTGSSYGESSSTSTGVSFGRGGMSTNFSTTRGRSMTSSSSQGTSDSWSVSESEGSSRGSSESLTEGASRTMGSSESETAGRTTGTTRGATRGSTRGSTTGTAETVHKRPLVAPDEIGRFFSRIDDRDNEAYPGFGLALVSGQAPVVYRRSNYFEDPEFIGYFMPHPDYGFSRPKKLEISQQGLKAFESHFPRLTWRAAVQRDVVVRRGAVLGYAVQPPNADIAAIRSPVDGRVVRVPGPPKSNLPAKPDKPPASLKELLLSTDGLLDASTRQFVDKLMSKPTFSPEVMKLFLQVD